jgi:hypothetical protein
MDTVGNKQEVLCSPMPNVGKSRRTRQECGGEIFNGRGFMC